MQTSDVSQTRKTRAAAPRARSASAGRPHPLPVPAPVAGAWQFSTEQQAIVSSGLLEASGVLCMPTGAGKTWLARLAVRAALRRGLIAIVVTPLRVIAREVAAQWQPEFTGHRISIQTGEVGADDDGDNPAPANADIIVATAEKLDLYCRRWSENLAWLARVDVVVVDEAHTMSRGRRGATLEGMLTRLRSVNPFVRRLGLSATLGNPHDLAAWLGGRAHVSTHRPIPLEWSVSTFGKAGSKQALVVDLASDMVAQGGQVIVFVQSRPRAETFAQEMQRQGLRALPHHAGLSRAMRDRAEQQYRQGEVDVLVATPTLAMGCNLPARLVVLADLQRFEHGQWRDLPTSEVWQLAGRAGRPGLDERGHVALLAPRWNQVAARRYIEGRFENVQSALADERLFAEQVMATVGSRLAVRLEQVQRVLAQTFFARNLALEVLTQLVGAAVDTMVLAGMLERSEDGVLRATRLGRIATRFLLTPATVLAWRELETRLPQASLIDVLLAVCASPDFSARLRVSFEDLPALDRSLACEPMSLGQMPVEDRKAVLVCRGRDLAAAARTALALRAWTRLGDLKDAAAIVHAHAHEVDEARMEAARLLQALQALLAAGAKERAQAAGTHEARGIGDEPDLAEKAAVLGAMVCAGADDEMSTLTLLDGVGPVLARRLASCGITDIEALALADTQDLAAVPGVSPARAARWIAAAGELVHNGGALRYREVARSRPAAPAPHGAGDTVLPRLDRYRWLRAQSLAVRTHASGWEVTGGSEPHQVRLLSPGRYSCDCPDARQHLCKHEIAVRHAEGDPGVPRFDAEPVACPSGFSLTAEWNNEICSCQ